MIKTIRTILYALISIICLLYCAVCVYYAGFAVSWIWLWPTVACFFAVRAFMLKKDIKLKGPVRAVYYAIVILALSVFAAGEISIMKSMHMPPADGLDYVITLGAGTIDGKPTNSLKLRIEKTIEYMQDNPCTVLIASGGVGKGETVSEAECIAEYVSAAGISTDRIIIENRSEDTEENIRFSLALIPEGKSIGIVTNDYHMHRALALAKVYGEDAVPLSTLSLYPLKIHYTVREFFAMAELRFLTISGKLPLPLENRGVQNGQVPNQESTDEA